MGNRPILINSGTDDHIEVVSFHPDASWFAVYYNDDTDEEGPLHFMRIVGWAFVRLRMNERVSEGDAPMLVGVQTPDVSDYSFDVGNGGEENFLDFVHEKDRAAENDRLLAWRRRRMDARKK